MAEIWKSGDESRLENESRLLELLRIQLVEKMPDYKIVLTEGATGSIPQLAVTHPGLQALLPNMEARVFFRYKKASFLSDYARRDVVGIRADFQSSSIDGFRCNQRNYGYDFKKERLKPSSFQKLVSFLKGETEAKIDQCQVAGNRRKAQKELLQQAADRLKAAGYVVTVPKWTLAEGVAERDIVFKVARPNGDFEQSMKVLTTGRLNHSLGMVDLKDAANFVGCLEQVLRYVK